MLGQILRHDTSRQSKTDRMPKEDMVIWYTGYVKYWSVLREGRVWKKN